MNIIVNAMRNYGYRCMSRDDGPVVFGKPVGYGILLAEVRHDETKCRIQVSLHVKGNKRADGEKPYLVWQKEERFLPPPVICEDYYREVVRVVAECEASILGHPLAISNNWLDRYDFIENTELLNELMG